MKEIFERIKKQKPEREAWEKEFEEKLRKDFNNPYLTIKDFLWANTIASLSPYFDVHTYLSTRGGKNVTTDKD